MARIGVDLGGTKIEAARLDEDGSLLDRRRRPTPQDDYAATLQCIADLVAELERDATSPCQVGVGHPGAISPATGLIKNANSTCLIGHDLKADLESRLGRQVRLANDADCFALSEAMDGAAAEASPVFGVILGTGVGGGIVVSGQLLQGPNAIAGEWGHNPLPRPTDDERPGPLCYCGRHGCIETFLSGPGLVTDYEQRRDQVATKKVSTEASPPGKMFGGEQSTHSTPGERTDGKPSAGGAPSGPAPGRTPVPARTRAPEAADVLKLAQSGDPAARSCLHAYQERLARALASVINIIDPEVIVLGGGLSQIASLYQRVPELWLPHVFSDRVDTRLVPPAHGDSSGVRGAARLWPA
jgi:fructokinase